MPDSPNQNRAAARYSRNVRQVKGRCVDDSHRPHANDDFTRLLKKYDDTVNELLALVESSSNEALYGEPWYEKYPLGRMIQLNSSSPYKNAHIRLRRWKKAARPSMG